MPLWGGGIGERASRGSLFVVHAVGMEKGMD
jgi:hypothetical protein